MQLTTDLRGISGRALLRRHSRRWQPYFLNTPAVAILVLVITVPMAAALWLSFQYDRLQRPDLHGFVGLANYAHLLTDPEFHSSLVVTLEFMAGTVALSMLGGSCLAFIANFRVPGRAVLRALIVLPWAIPSVVNALMWGWVFNGEVGLFNAILRQAHLISQYQSWLGTPGTALPVVIVAQAWNSLPVTTVFLLAALQSIPEEMHEVAAVDGAGVFRRFVHVTLPWISQPLVVVLVFQTILSLRTFELIYVLTGGGPGSATTVLSLAAYTKAFTSFDFGVASAYAYMIALIGLVLAATYIVLLFRRSELDI